MAKLEAGFDFKRLPGTTRESSQAFWRKITTQDARLAMAGIIKQYEQILSRMKAASPEALEEAMKPIFKQAQYYTPEDTGNLWASGKLESGRNKSGAFARIQFGDDTAWYAALVHEFTWLHHQQPERAKYLQSAMEEGMDKLIEHVGARLAAGLK